MTSPQQLAEGCWRFRERVENGTLTLHGWYFDIEHGQLLRYNAATNVFEPL